MTCSDFLLLYDCDGVLVDSEALAAKIESDVLRTLGILISADELLQRFAGHSSQTMLEVLRGEYGADVDYLVFMRYCNTAMATRFFPLLKPVPGITELLSSLQFKKCVASTSPRQRVLLSLYYTGLLSHFPHSVFTRDDVCAPKPAPDVYHFARRAMGFENRQCLAIEDSVNGVRAATAAHIPTIGFAGASHCSSATPASLKSAGAVEVASDTRELYTLITRIAVTAHR